MSRINYSVLMSVYYKENPLCLEESMESIYNQTFSTNDFVLVCDGPLNDELDEVIQNMQKKFGSVLNVVRLEKNSGLGTALNIGLQHCKNEIVARMDSDDISFLDRCEKQIKYFEENDKLSIVSGTILEFEGNINTITGKRKVPLSNQEICKYSKKRSPFNHPAVMFKKSDVQKVGGYNEEYHLFEDYYLWIRMLRAGCIGANISSPLVYLRTSSDMYMRRGGQKYAKDMLRLHKWLLDIKWSNYMDYLCGAIPHAVICVLPNSIRKFVYFCMHR